MNPLSVKYIFVSNVFDKGIRIRLTTRADLGNLSVTGAQLFSQNFF